MPGLYQQLPIQTRKNFREILAQEAFGFFCSLCQIMFLSNGADFKYTWPSRITVSGEKWVLHENSADMSSYILHRKKQTREQKAKKRNNFQESAVS